MGDIVLGRGIWANLRWVALAGVWVACDEPALESAEDAGPLAIEDEAAPETEEAVGAAEPEPEAAPSPAPSFDIITGVPDRPNQDRFSIDLEGGIAPGPVDRELRSVTVYYGTNRARSEECIGASQADVDADCEANAFFSGLPSPSGTLEVGRLVVTFPKDHERGNIERPVQVFSLQLRDEDPERDVVIASIEAFADQDDYARWVNEVQRTGHDQAFIYVHGYNTTFASAARTTAQVAYDLDFDVYERFPGLVMLFSWPSRGSTLQYLSDREASLASAEAFLDFLRLVKERAGLRRVHVIAHSMGNRLVANALWPEAALPGQAGKLLDQLVLAAPDIDADLFRTRFLQNLPRRAKRVTLYVSGNDAALQASQLVARSGARAGQPEGALLADSDRVEGFDAVDASELPADWLHHSYYANNESMLSDLYCLLQGTPVDRRPLLTRQADGWTFRDADQIRNLNSAVCPPASVAPGPSSGSWGWTWFGGAGAALLAGVGAVFATRRR